MSPVKCRQKKCCGQLCVIRDQKVPGGTGNIGSATVRAFLQEGSCKNVVFTSRRQERIDKAIASIRDDLGADAASKVIGIVGTMTKEESAAELKQKVINAVGDRLDFVASTLGIPFVKMAPLIEITDEQMHGIFDDVFYAPLGAYRAFMPLVKNCCGSYVFLTGDGPDMYLGLGTGVMTIGGSVSNALARVAMKESAEDIFCSEVSFLTNITPEPEKMPPGPIWLSSADAGAAIVSVATKRKAHAQTVTVASESDMRQAIANGIVETGNGKK